MRARAAMLTLATALATACPVSAAPPDGFGNQWVRAHPFTRMGLNLYASSLELPEYQGAGLDSLLVWMQIPEQTALAGAGGLPWHAHITPADQGPDAYLQSLVNQAAVSPGGLGWLLHDEPSRLQMPGIGSAAAWIRQNHPGMPVYGNAFPSYATATQLYGDGSNPSYGWPEYLDDFLAIIEPDVLMYDYYPFESDGDTKDTYWSDLMTIRSKALGANVPYWAFVQAWASAYARLPSESDLRMQIYSYLAAGYSGLAYFTYDHFEDGGLLDASGNPTQLYARAADVNAEVGHLGHSLRFLTSTDVRYLPGQYLLANVWLTDNPIPAGVTGWSPGAGGDPHITSADVDSSSPSNYGLGKDGLLGLFTDDYGRHYFLLVNLWHAAEASSASTTLPLVVEFDATVTALRELDRDTGEQTVVPLTDHRLALSLPGGTGRLFKYDDGGFPPEGGPGGAGGGGVAGAAAGGSAAGGDGVGGTAAGGGLGATGPTGGGSSSEHETGGCACGLASRGLRPYGWAAPLSLPALALTRRRRRRRALC
jgi:hypothetical protein